MTIYNVLLVSGVFIAVKGRISPVCGILVYAFEPLKLTKALKGNAWYDAYLVNAMTFIIDNGLETGSCASPTITATKRLSLKRECR